jgi:glucokinase
MVTFGTGIGTAALIAGRLLRGRHGQAGCLGGHLTVRYGGRQCSCGNAGCAEAEASTAFLRAVAEARPEFSTSALAESNPLDYAAVFAAADAGDACAVAVRDHSLLVWGALAVSLIHAYDPERVILGGGIMRSAGTILPWIADYVRRHAHTPWGKVEVRASELGDDAALLGCSVLLEETL